MFLLDITLATTVWATNIFGTCKRFSMQTCLPLWVSLEYKFVTTIHFLINYLNYLCRVC